MLMHNKGYTLLELIMALLVIALVVTPLVPFMLTQGTLDMETRQYNKAILAAAAYLDCLSAQPFEQVEITSGQPVTINSEAMWGTAAVSFIDAGSLERTLTPTDTKAATITVFWKSRAATESVTLSNILTPRYHL